MRGIDDSLMLLSTGFVLWHSPGRRWRFPVLALWLGLLCSVWMSLLASLIEAISVRKRDGELASLEAEGM